jgi:hypothetical protein
MGSRQWAVTKADGNTAESHKVKAKSNTPPRGNLKLET